MSSCAVLGPSTVFVPVLSGNCYLLWIVLQFKIRPLWLP